MSVLSAAMSLGRLPSFWSAVAVVAMTVGCRGRTAATTAGFGVNTPGERAALLVLDGQGRANLVCLPEGKVERDLFPGTALGQILDVAWKNGTMVAGRTGLARDGGTGVVDDLVVLLPNGGRAQPATGVRAARFSPDATALVYETVAPGEAAIGTPEAPTSFVLDLASGKVTALGALADPLWEADSMHIRATRLRSLGEEHATANARSISLRVRCDRAAGTVTPVGFGSAQIPAPRGEAVAWSPLPPSATPRDSCTILVGRPNSPRHTIVGRFCAGSADDRGARWSPDGQWLAFARPGPLPRRQGRDGFFVDVVGVEGGRSPALSSLYARAQPEQIAIAASPDEVWLDWSPSRRFLAISDGAHELRLYDFEAGAIARLGKGRGPTWSPGGAFVLAFEGGEAPPSQLSRAFLLTSAMPGAKRDLGPVRAARWLPGEACRQ